MRRFNLLGQQEKPQGFLRPHYFKMATSQFKEPIKMNGFLRRKIVGKSYGFIEGEDQRDYFVYWNDFNRHSIPFRNAKDAGPDQSDKANADRVTYDVEESPSGPKAKNVFVLRTNDQPEKSDVHLSNVTEGNVGKPDAIV